MKYRLACFMLAAASLCVATSAAQVSEQDSLALVAIYQATDGDNWRKADPQSSGSWGEGPNWLNGPVNTWHSVTVTEGRVTKIYTEFLLMKGELPPELGDLTALTELFITHDQFLSGAIPDEIGNLTSLQKLGVYGTGIDKPIPSTIGQLTELEVLELPFNKLGGPIPPEIGYLVNLEDLVLMENELTGVVPTEVEQLVKLRNLNVENNTGLSGPLPAGLVNITELRNVRIDNTSICGPLEPSFQAWLEQVAGVTQTSCPVTTEEQKVTPVQLELSGLFPAPASDRVTVRYKLQQAEAVRIDFFDLLGRRVISNHVPVAGPGDHSLQVDVSGLSSGTYLMRLSAGGHIDAQTVVIRDE